MLKKILAVVAGVVVAVVIIMLVEMLGHSVYPPPTDIDFSDKEAMAGFFAELPIGALLFVMIAWLAGTFAGGTLACFIVRERPQLLAACVGGFVLFATTITLLQLPHPMWFAVTSVLAIIATTYLTGVVGAVFSKSDNAVE